SLCYWEIQLSPEQKEAFPKVRWEIAISDVVNSADVMDVKAEFFEVKVEQESEDEVIDVRGETSYERNIKLEPEEMVEVVIKQEVDPVIEDLTPTTECNDVETTNESGELKIKSEEAKVFKVRRKMLCQICNKTFTHKSNLIRHIRTHTGERPYICDVCGCSFLQNSDLTMHKRLHTGDKPFFCNVCNRAFAQNRSLTLHKRLHTGDRPYSCDLCEKSYTQYIHLVRHKRTHTGDRPFCCNVCNKSFIENCDLIRHLQSHSSERSFFCDLCNKSFTMSSSLIRHNRRTHTTK
ncbi:hypothetical protein C0J52_22193, partial [Blattella germanica]